MKNFLKINQQVRCSAGIDYCVLMVSGNVYRCFVKSKEFIFGNIYDIKQIKFESKICDGPLCTEICEKQLTQQWDINGNKINQPTWLSWPTVEEFQFLDKSNIFIHAEICKGCISKCPYCRTTKENIDFTFINTEKCIEFIEFINKTKNGIKVFNICGLGEPTFHPDFVSILNRALDLGYKVNLSTSGLGINEKIYQLDLSKDLGISVSLHPLSPIWDEKKVFDLLKDMKLRNTVRVCSFLVSHPDNMKHYDKLNNKLSQLDVRLDVLNYDPSH